MKQTKRKHTKTGRLNIHKICLFSILGALLFAAKTVMAFLPNIEPVSLMVLCLAACFGWSGLIPVYIYVACEFLFWGIGPWSICYLYIWAILFLAGMAAKKLHLDSPVIMACFASVFGLLFGALCALPMCLAGGWSAAFAWWQAGIPFDLLHGMGNFFIVLLLYAPLYKLISMLKIRFAR